MSLIVTEIKTEERKSVVNNKEHMQVKCTIQNISVVYTF